MVFSIANYNTGRVTDVRVAFLGLKIDFSET